MGKKKVSDEILIESYNRLKNIWKVGDEVGLCGQSVQERLVKMGIDRSAPRFSAEDEARLAKDYTRYLLDGRLSELAKEMGRTKQFICRKAKDFGLTDLRRGKKVIKGYKPTRVDWSKHGHPRGFLGGKHSDEAKAIIAHKSSKSNQLINQSGRRVGMIEKMIKTKMERGNLVNPRLKQTWKAGWRIVNGNSYFFRSRWEANYARYLELMRNNGLIEKWEHEPDVFLLEGKGFLPDFKLTITDNAIEYHEVKGWMDERSKNKIEKMAILHPEIDLKIITASWFRSNKHLSAEIPEWEQGRI
jgi:hypothetical protein